MKTIAKNDIQVMVEEFLGRRKSAVVAGEILSAMQAEYHHMHDGSVFYVYKDEMGDLVLTMESFVKVRIEKILRLIAEGWSEKEAWKSICHDSEKLGHYKNSANARPELEPTGSRKTAGKCDLANTRKILAKDEKARGFWLAGGNYNDYSVNSPIANLDFDDDYGYRYAGCVGWFVI